MPALVDRNYVVIFGQRIARPSYMSPSEWLDYWRPLDGGHQDALDNTGRGTR